MIHSHLSSIGIARLIKYVIRISYCTSITYGALIRKYIIYCDCILIVVNNRDVYVKVDPQHESPLW